MIPFRVSFRSGRSPYSELVYAVKKALISGQIRPSQAFPSVRTLSQELRINPNTAHKAVAELVREGILEVRPGIGTVVGQHALSSFDGDLSPLDEDLERLVVEARGLGLDLEALTKAIARHWTRLQQPASTREPHGSHDRRNRD